MGIYRSISNDGDVTYNTINVTSITGSVQGTASFSISSSYALTASFLLGSSGSNINASSLATTGSNIFKGNQTITGSIYLKSGSLFGTSSYAIEAITSSYPISVNGSTLYSVNPLAGISSNNNSIFFGKNAGAGALYAFNSTFLGQNSGLNAYSANNSNFLGYNAGVGSFNGVYSNFIGNQAGYQAAEAKYSIFIGNNAGYKATNASYSILLGHNTGKTISGNEIGSNNIIIGSNITLENNRKDSINIGGIIFATGSYSTSSGDPYSGSMNEGRVGIGVINPLYSLDVSGSGNFSNGLTVTGSLNISGSITTTGTITAQTLVVQTITSSISFITGSTRFGSLLTNTHQFTGSVSMTGSLNVTNGITGSLFGTASFALTASFVPTSSLTSNFFVQDGNSFGAQAVLGTNDVQNLAFETSGSVRMFISGSNGNVGIGTTTPGKKLEVSGSDALINGITVGIGGGSMATNTAIGSQSLASNTTGIENTANGYIALYSNTTGNYNTANGTQALYSNTTGTENSAIGRAALYFNITGQKNTANGIQALYLNTSGSNNTATGYLALGFNTTANNNTANGYRALYSNTTGNYNTALGLHAGYGSGGGNANTTGENNIFIGYESVGVSATGSNRTWIGNSSTTSTWLAGNLLLGTTTDEGYRLNVNGSANISGSVTITGSLNVTAGITGSLLGTASYAANANTASYVLNAVSASFALTASFVANAQTASYVLNAVSASFASTASFVQNAVSSSFASTASFVQNAQTASYVLNAVSASFASTASLAQTASYVLNAVSASFATSASQAQNASTASYILNAVSASFASTASFVLNAVSSSFATSASFASTASFVQNAQTASYVLNAVSASFASTASFVVNAQTASFVQNAVTASYVLNAVSASFATSASQAQNATTASYVLQAVSSSFATSASYALSASQAQNATSASFATTATTSSYADNFTVAGTLTAQTLVVQTITSSVSFITGSTQFGSLLANTHQFTGSVSMTGSLDVAGGINSRNTRVDATRKFPIGHYAPGETVFEFDPTWTQAQMQDYMGSAAFTWNTDSTAPGGYSIQVDGDVSVGNVAYSSGFPFIPTDTGSNDWYYMECWIRNETGSVNNHYMGGIDYNESFASLGGNPGSYTYNVMLNYDPGTAWTKVFGYWNGFGNGAGGGGTGNTNNWEVGTKYFGPQALFNYTNTSGTRRCYISGWKIIRVSQQGNRYFQNNVLVTGSVGIGTTTPGYKLDVSGTANINGNATITGSLNVTAGITGSLLGTSSFATTASFVQNAVTASYILNAVSASYALSASQAQNATSASFATTATTSSYADNFTVAGTLTAQTIVVQTITSSIDFVTGSTRFGSLLANTHQFTGSVSMTGSLAVTGTANISGNVGIGTSSPNTKLHIVTATGENFQNAIKLEKAGGYGESIIQNYYTDVTNYGLGFQVGSSTKVVVNIEGEVGIGTISPEYKLHIIGDESRLENTTAGVLRNTIRNNSSDAAAMSMLVVNSYGNSWGIGMGSTANNSNALVFRIDELGSPVEKMRLTSGGNLGIGTNNPATTLQIGDGTGTRQLYINGATNDLVLGISGGAVMGISSGDITLMFTTTNKPLGISNGSANPLIFGTTDLERMRITSGGDVGIGTTSPLANFQVGDGSALTNYQGGKVGVMLPAGSGTWIELADNTTNGTAFRISKDLTTGITFNSNGREIGFKADSYSTAITDAQLTLKTSGNVGIGTTTPGYKLDVSGSANISGNVTITGSLIISQSLITNQNTSSLSSGAQTISTNSTSSFTSAFYKYTLLSGSNARAGQVMAVWNGANIQYNDVSTNDIGTTLNVALTASLSGGNVLLTTTLPSSGWTIKTQATFI